MRVKKRSPYPYHSFWLEEEPYEPIDEVVYEGNYGFVQDLSGDYPTLLPMVPDCIYTELSFVAGYKDFSERAETKGSYRNYVSGLSKMVWIYSIPVYMIGQKNTLKSLRPDRLLSIQVDYPMEQFRGFVAVWRDEVIDVHSRTEILVYLNKNYKMVYDPCCGYLSIARFMPDCKFMFSDSNPKCIGGALATLKELYGNEKAN